ncbi:MAG: VCBS repeat-containing protein [Anaerolineae bacterium]|nr:VCBS repeat-containing protein [Anaerolineae bacterium]
MAILVPAPCSYEERHWMYELLVNLGHGSTETPIFDLTNYNFQKLEVDVDQDNEREIVLFGGGQINSVFAGVLDWDGIRWRVAWFDRLETRYSGKIRVQVDDFDGDAQTELLVETLTHPCSGSGVLCQLWEVSLLKCERLHCSLIWTYPLAENNQFMGDYERINNEYCFLKSDDLLKADIEVLQHGITFDRERDEETRTLTLPTISVLTTTRTIFEWHGAEYVQTMSIILKPEYMLNNKPVTETVDFDSDGTLERVVYDWTSADEQTLSIYQRSEEEWHLTQVFSASVTGSPDTGVFLDDFDGDELVDIVVCQPIFARTVSWDNSSEWPSVRPSCTVYEWSSNTRIFQFIGQRS